MYLAHRAKSPKPKISIHSTVKVWNPEELLICSPQCQLYTICFYTQHLLTTEFSWPNDIALCSASNANERLKAQLALVLYQTLFSLLMFCFKPLFQPKHHRCRQAHAPASFFSFSSWPRRHICTHTRTHQQFSSNNPLVYPTAIWPSKESPQVSVATMTHAQWTAAHWVTLRTDWKGSRKARIAQPVCRPRFQAGTFRIRSRSAVHSATTFRGDGQ